MAYKIVFRSGRVDRKVEKRLWKMIYGSRFSFHIDQSKPDTLSIHRVRLKVAKSFCGNHPGACPVGGAPKIKRNFLEGADWVEFNDRINWILDDYSLSADVSSAICIVRKETFRRIAYSGEPGAEWDRDCPSDDYVDCCGRKAARPKSDFPIGTPGIYKLKPREEKHEIVQGSLEPPEMVGLC